MFQIMFVISIFSILLSLTTVKGELLSVIIIVRHGARAPYKFNSLSPYNNEKYFPEGPAQLTNAGRLGILQLGTKLRERYQSHLEPHSSRKSRDIRIVSTNTTRTLETAQILSYALYPPDANQKWTNEINWFPVAVPLTNAIKSCRTCPNFKKDMKGKFAEISKLPLFQNLHQQILEIIGESLSVTDVSMLVDSIHIAEKAGFKPPDWITKYDYHELRQWLYKNMVARTSGTNRMKRLSSGPLVEDIIIRIREVIEGEDFSKIFIYSAHDGTIAGMMEVLGVPLHVPPGFGSTIIFEIHSRNNSLNPRIKLIYSHNTTFVEEDREILNCGYVCTFQQFVELTKPFIPNDWKEECGVRERSTVNSVNSVNSVTYFLNLIFMIFCVCLTFLISN